ncbi:hypothetical protein [Streptomyces sp. NPDC127040]|uniref:hypothetical protein n=1 Tax=Streptomyces sp. NPDC127040 TaxID=3347116 RepID=UPI0036667B90
MTTPQQPPSADDLLMGGGGPPSAKFPVLGYENAGRIVGKPTVEQQRDYDSDEPLYWADGKPRWQIVVTLATGERDPEISGDDGVRRLYVKSQMKTAVQAALKAAKADGLEEGGHLTVTYTADGEQPNPKKHPPKQYTARYVTAANAELMTPEPIKHPPTAAASPAAVPAVAPALSPEQIAALLAQLGVAPVSPPPL